MLSEDWPVSLRLLQFPQPLPSLIQRRVLFAERKSHLFRSIPRIVVETRSWDRRNANLFHQIFRERHIVVEAKRADIRHHVISSARTKAAKSRFRQRWHQPIAPRF